MIERIPIQFSSQKLFNQCVSCSWISFLSSSGSKAPLLNSTLRIFFSYSFIFLRRRTFIVNNNKWACLGLQNLNILYVSLTKLICIFTDKVLMGISKKRTILLSHFGSNILESETLSGGYSHWRDV